jgi:hypothetical protein
VNAQQLEIEFFAQRVGLIQGRVWFGAGNAVNVILTAKQRRSLLRFFRRHGLKQYLVLDGARLRRRARPARLSDRLHCERISTTCPSSPSIMR